MRLTTCFLLLMGCTAAAYADAPKPLRALLIAGGCCHDYAAQQEILAEGIEARANVRVDVWWTDDKSTNPSLAVYEDLTWADGYDVIIHDECAAANDNVALVKQILKVHETVPAVHLHCAMHSFRNGTDLWFDHLGLTSRGHGPQAPIEVVYVQPDHPINAPLENWATGNEELYSNAALNGATPVAMGQQTFTRDGKTRTEEVIVAWTNEQTLKDGKKAARSFSTTLGHNNTTVADDRYLDLVTRGLLWASNRLSDDMLTPYEGEHTVTHYKKPEPPKTPAVRPDNATDVRVSASSTQDGHPAIDAFDGNPETRWCADGDSYPQWLQVEFKEPTAVNRVGMTWEFDKPYSYIVEGSLDGEAWTTLIDHKDQPSAEQQPQPVKSDGPVRFVRLTGLSGDGWCSVREFVVEGPELNALWPVKADWKTSMAEPTLADPYKSAGNAPPKIERISPEEEAAILRDVKVPDGFEVSLFAAPPAVNYPVFVAAAPDGTLYVSSDGNGSLGRDPGRGRIIRLRDTDGDGRADETNEFCKIDAPRGLVWDNDRLYVMHPPHLSEFIDEDGDGVAEAQNILVRDLAFGYDERPADHTTNGLTLGLDGYLYVAGGDFGFMNATGTDGRTLTHRGGGVIRVRTDGTGLELYSTGTRNILEVACSPTMEMFARDNTNDGGGWDVRFHHFTGGDDHGYPRLFTNFPDECIQPLADYGGGSGCGAVYLHEPGWGEWNDAPLTADWGKGAIFRHDVEPDGATFQETAPPEPLVQMTRPTDADVDAFGNLYAASWKGATFRWEGPNVGYIVRVRPRAHDAAAPKDVASLSVEELAREFSSDSLRRQKAAMQELRRRDTAAADKLLAERFEQRTPERNVIESVRTTATDEAVADALSHSDPVVRHVAVRELAARDAADVAFARIEDGDVARTHALRALAMMHRTGVVAELTRRLTAAEDPVLRKSLLAALCRLNFREAEWQGQSWGTRPDIRGPYYEPVAWEQTDAITSLLQREVQTAEPEVAVHLVAEMGRNRIVSDAAVARIVNLASSDRSFAPVAVAQIAGSENTPAAAYELIAAAATDIDADADTLVGAVMALSRVDDATVAPSVLHALGRLDRLETTDKQRNAAHGAFLNGRILAAAFDRLIDAVERGGPSAKWAAAGLLSVASGKTGTPDDRARAARAHSPLCQAPDNRGILIDAAVSTQSRQLDEQIWAASQAKDDLASAAMTAVRKLKISPPTEPSGPRIATLAVDDVIAAVVNQQGEAARGQQLFARANCIACHTVEQGGPSKGPYLGNIAQTYKRADLAAAVLAPSRTIAQGFKTTVLITADGRVVTGFVTNEAADAVTLRDHTSREFVVRTEDIDERMTTPQSVMPEGLMNAYTVEDLASLVTYLESLSHGS